jgi:hypothetical protein
MSQLIETFKFKISRSQESVHARGHKAYVGTCPWGQHIGPDTNFWDPQEVADIA